MFLFQLIDGHVVLDDTSCSRSSSCICNPLYDIIHPGTGEGGFVNLVGRTISVSRMLWSAKKVT